MYLVKCRIKQTSPPLHTVNSFGSWHEAMVFASFAEWSEVSDRDGQIAVCINGEWFVTREHEMAYTIENGAYDEETGNSELLDDLLGEDMATARSRVEDDDDDLLGDMPAKKSKKTKVKMKAKANGKMKAKAKADDDDDDDEDEDKPKKRKGGPRKKRAQFPDTGVIRVIKPRRVRPGTNAALVYGCVKDGITVKKFKAACEKAGSTKDPNGSIHWLVNSGNIRVK